jgi:hypothetical protein
MCTRFSITKSFHDLYFFCVWGEEGREGVRKSWTEHRPLRRNKAVGGPRAFFCFPRETSEKIIEHRTLITTLTCSSVKYVSDYGEDGGFFVVVCVVVSIFMAVRDYNFGIRFLKILLYIYVVRDSIRWGIFHSIFVIPARFRRQKIDLWM